jgi:hypothetical protein
MLVLAGTRAEVTFLTVGMLCRRPEKLSDWYASAIVQVISCNQGRPLGCAVDMQL